MFVSVFFIEYIEKNDLVERAKILGKYLTENLLQIQKESQIIGEVRGPGLFIGIEFVKDKETKEPFPEGVKKLISLAWKKGVNFATGGIGQVLKIKPPITIEKNILIKSSM